jgi:hypothetical protein
MSIKLILCLFLYIQCQNAMAQVLRCPHNKFSLKYPGGITIPNATINIHNQLKSKCVYEQYPGSELICFQKIIFRFGIWYPRLERFNFIYTKEFTHKKRFVDLNYKMNFTYPIRDYIGIILKCTVTVYEAADHYHSLINEKDILFI